MLIKRKNNLDLTENDVTDPQLFAQRRQFIQASGKIAIAASLLPLLGSGQALADRGANLKFIKPKQYQLDEELTDYKDAITYNNFYEFGTKKEDPARNAAKFQTKPWHVEVAGEAELTGQFSLEDLIKPHTLEERIYRFRCVEAWSMVVPWVGVSLGEMLKRFKPTSKAKYVEFTTLYDPERMPGQRRGVLDWPYNEALTIEEAMHPLSMMVVGMYGEELPNQNGAPLRLMVPWKYGFKNIKSIVRIRFLETRPATTWAVLAPNEYGFYANVNPKVDHPRWSQKRERRLGDFFKRETLLFNGYAEQVASLYQGLDLRKNF